MEIADLHIHSRYSRATSKDISLEKLSHWAKIKGLTILGTGDFTHPSWLEELKENLKEIREGIYEYDGTKYILQTEINNVFEMDGKVRKVHNVILAKSFDVVDVLNENFSRYGDLKEDGRPTLMLSCEEMMELFSDGGLFKDIFIFPAHAWTPWFGIYGSKSGFDSINECFGKYSKYVFAIETGLSSDPDMNALVDETRSLSLLSNSDAHSYWPWRLGREANIFYEKDLSFDEIIERIKNKKLETVEVDPSYGKYHFDGHRKCNICLHPLEAIKLNNLCPYCGKKLTLGVMHRVYDLSRKYNDEGLKHKQKFYRLLPLHEILSLRYNKNMNSKEIWKVYEDLISRYGNEYQVLLFADISLEDKVLEDLIIRNRKGEIFVKPGCDGMYGIPVISQEDKENKKAREEIYKKQKNIFDYALNNK